MYLARLRLNRSRRALLWAANPYRVHQRLLMAFEGEPRLLFRLEEHAEGSEILVQAHIAPDWTRAFGDFPVLAAPPEHKEFALRLQPGACYRFRLLANPTVKRAGRRLGLLREEEQRAWLVRKLDEAGAEVLGCRANSLGLQRSERNPAKDEHIQTHLAVLYEGMLRVADPERLARAVATGIGAGKGYGFGLLSLARAG